MFAVPLTSTTFTYSFHDKLWLSYKSCVDGDNEPIDRPTNVSAESEFLQRLNYKTIKDMPLASHSTTMTTTLPVARSVCVICVCVVSPLFIVAVVVVGIDVQCQAVRWFQMLWLFSTTIWLNATTTVPPHSVAFVVHSFHFYLFFFVEIYCRLSKFGVARSF